MDTAPPAPPRDEIKISAPELRWVIATLVSLVASLAFMISWLITDKPILGVAASGLFAAYGFSRWRLRVLERRHEVVKPPRPLVVELFLLAIMFPFVAGLLMLIFGVIAMINGTSVAAGLARGAISGAILVIGIGLVGVAGRIVGMLKTKEDPNLPKR